MKNPTKYFFISLTLLLLNATAFAQTIEEVTVTAARKEQSVQDVAISVQAITNEDLRLGHIETADDLTSTIPGFDFTEGLGSGVILKIRGLTMVTIGSAIVEAGITAQNGHHINNRPFSTTGFYDADRIEILEGPQGTLYGRNSTTGLINFITAKPGADQYLSLTAGADGLSQFKFARDFELSDTVMMRIAATKYDSDGVIYNAGTGNDIDDRDSFGARATLVAEMNDQNTLTVQFEKVAINDSRQNYGLSACDRDAFFGCNPLTSDFSPHLNAPTLESGAITSTFTTLTDINASGADLFADTFANRINSIDSINKDLDPYRKDNMKIFSLTNVSELDDLTVTVKGTFVDQDLIQFNDNDHSNATGALNSTFIPAPAFSIAELRTHCLGTLTNVTTNQAFECSDTETTTQQYEVNVVSDFDGPFNFTAGAYVYKDTTWNQYNIQLTPYLLLNDFDQHPYSTSGLFGTYTPTMNTYGGQGFYAMFAGQLQANAADITAATNAAGAAAIQSGATQGDATFVGATTVALVGQLQTNVGPDITAACIALNPAFAISGHAAEGVNPCVKSLPAQAGGLNTDQHTQRNSQALYGELYFDVLDNLKITLGARYMDDRFGSQVIQGLSDTAGAYAGTAACLTTNYDACWQSAALPSDDKNEVATYKAAVQYDYADGMVYASYVTGNRPQGANPDSTVFAESESKQIEIGTRNILFGGALRLNATYFTTDIEDGQTSTIRFAAAYVEPHDMTHEGLQFNVQGFVTPTTIISVSALATDSTYDTVAATTDNVTASTTLGYIYANGSLSLDPHNPTNATSFTNYTRAQAGAIAVGASNADTVLQTICSNVAAIANFCPTVTYAQDSNGNWLINPLGEVYAIANSSFTPLDSEAGFSTYNQLQEIGGNKVVGTVDLETTVTLTQMYQFAGGSGMLNLSYHYKDAYFNDFFNTPRFTSPSTEYFNFNATYEPDNADWYLNLWARNLTDKRYINSIAKNSNLQGGNPYLTFDQGRKVGLDFGYNF